MFRYIGSFFNHDAGDQAAAHPTLMHDDKAQVFIWSGDSHNVGHVAIQFDGSAAKRSEDNASVYASIWPDRYPAVGPLTLLPLHATLANDLNRDTRLESQSFNVEVDASGEVLMRRIGEPKQPDKTFVISHLDKDKMLAEYDRIKSGVQSGKVCYQLFPALKTTSTEVYNCTTLADHMLKAGGMTTLPKSATWRPSAFADILEKQPNTTLKQDDDSLPLSFSSPN